MTREQIETVLKTAGAKQDKDGSYGLAEGTNLTLHVSHDGASLSVQKVDNIRFDGELLFAKAAKQAIALVITDVYAITAEGSGGQPARRPAGFL